MDILDLASKGIVKITKNYGNKIKKNSSAPILAEAQPAVISGDGYRLGFAKEEIMPSAFPEKTYYIAGHGSGHKMESILSKVYISACWLDCGGKEGMLWLSADIVGLTRVEVNKIRSMIRSSGLTGDAKLINISCTHSHSGIDTIGYWGKPNALKIPSDGKDAEYMNMLMQKAVKASAEAYKNAVKGKLYSGCTEIKNGLHPKRKFNDRHEILSRLRFVPENGGNETWIMNFGAHPNSLGGANRALSGEYPYFMREKIKADSNADVLFGIGPLGGMDAAILDNDDPVNCVKLQGKMIAEAAESITDETELLPEIKYINQEFYLPVGNYVLMLLAMRHVMSFEAFPCSESDTGIAMKTEMTYLSLGTQKILLLPGENFVTTVFGGYADAQNSTTGKGAEINPEPLCDISGDGSMIVFGITNDMTGYVVPPNDFVLNPTQPYLNGTKDRFGDNHYHETNSMGIGTQKVIADTFKKVVNNFNK